MEWKLGSVILPVLQMFNVISSTRTPCVNEQENEYNEETSFGWDSRGWDVTCPYTCVLWTMMCRGVNFCNSDVESCRSDLKCPRTYDSKAYSIIKMNLSITVAKNHYYCLMVREVLESFYAGWVEGISQSYSLSFCDRALLLPCLRDGGVGGLQHFRVSPSVLGA